MEDNTVILIGGAPTVGKTTIARQLSERLKLPWISTDQIRDLMKGVVSKKDFLNLFSTQNYSAEEYLMKFTPEQIVQNQNNESKDVWKGVKVFIEEDYVWNSYIIEGVAILPEFVKRDLVAKQNIKTIFLIDEDANKIRDVVYNRGLWDDAHTYSDEVKEREVEWALLFSRWLKEEAGKYNFPVVEVTKDEKDMEEIIKVLDLE